MSLSVNPTNADTTGYLILNNNELQTELQSFEEGIELQTESLPYEEVTPEYKLKDLITPIPHGIEEDHAKGRKHSPLAADCIIVSLFSAGALIFPAPLSISLSEDAGLASKNMFRHVELLVMNKIEKRKLVLEAELSEATELGEITTELKEEIKILKKQMKSADQGKLIAKVVKYLFLGGILAGCGLTDLTRSLSQQDALHLLPKAGGILTMALDRDQVEYLRPTKTKNADGKKIKIPQALWKKIALLGITYTAGTGTIFFDLSPVLTNGLLNSSSTSIKFIAKDIGWKKCSLGLGIVTAAALASNCAGLALRQWIPLNTFFKYSTPVLISTLNIDATAAIKIAQEKLVGTDDDDDDVEEDKRTPPAHPAVQGAFLALALTVSLAALYYKFSSLDDLDNPPSISTKIIPRDILEGEHEGVNPMADYAISLLTALPLKFTGRLAFHMMKKIPGHRVVTPLIGGGLLLAETASFPFQYRMPIVAIVALTAFAAIASRLIENTIKDVQLGKNNK